ncbi:phosphatidylinositol 3- and 4-kinase [Nitzschia inconspicua]|uniref:Phosphatidylinositol 3- and 4-kinase n=1 Tax=Nitzschia inconspicua TaxID=303405 RepID=A0A9K3PW52_9STRA|nr:phosphatidylinositol 3- and 4-kinase [Nitzschia inconspicua]
MIAAAAYYAYREHQKSQQQQQEQQQTEDEPNQNSHDNVEGISGGINGLDSTTAAAAATAVAGAIATTTSPSSWFQSLPLEDATFQCYFGNSDDQCASHQYCSPAINNNNNNNMINNKTMNNRGATDDQEQETIAANETLAGATPQPLESTTFRKGVRKEWIHAVFGTDFPRKSDHDTEISPKSINPQHNACITSAWKGVGLSQIPSYTTYTVELPQPNNVQSSSVQTHKGSNGTKSLTADAAIAVVQPPKLGVTLSRLTLGLYVRHVHPGSEAWCAGVQQDSILVSINHGTINLLAEPTKAALERVWQYEGLGSSSSTTSSIAKAQDNDTNRNTLGNNGTALSSCITIQEPISMTFIRGGKMYDVLFLSNPPYGIDWAPCGDFCLINKVSSQRSTQAGILPSSIVARVSVEELDGDAEQHEIDFSSSVYDLDYETGTAMMRQAAQSNGTVRIQLCFPPNTARSGYWERQQDAASERDQAGRSGVPGNAAVSKSTLTNNITRPQRPDVSVELDGVQVRVHSLLSGGIFRSNRSQNNPLPGHLADLSNLATRVAFGENISPYLMSSRRIVSTTNSLQEWDKETKEFDSGDVGGAQNLSFPERRSLRPCPKLERPLAQCWEAHQAMSYICRYHSAAYDEQKLMLPCGSEDCNAFDFFLQHSPQAGEIYGYIYVSKTFLLLWMPFLMGNADPSLKGAMILLELAQQNISQLAHPMEFLACAFGNEDLRMALDKLRRHRVSVMNQSRSNQKPSPPVPEKTQPESTKDQQSDRKEHKRGRKPHETTAPLHAPRIIEADKKGIQKSRPRRRIFRFFRRPKQSTRRHRYPVKDATAAVVMTGVEETGRSAVDMYPPAITEAANAYLKEECSPSPPNDGSLAKLSVHDVYFQHCLSFLEELKYICEDIENSLMESFSQKFTRWALLPWTPSKETALAQVTQTMRERLKICNRNETVVPLVNPIDTTEAFLAIDYNSCFVLPSAHFPLMLTFDCERRASEGTLSRQSRNLMHSGSTGNDILYRTVVELVKVHGFRPKNATKRSREFCVHASVAGCVLKSDRSVGIDCDSNLHVWDMGNTLVFESRSAWGPPRTLSLRLTEFILEEDRKESSAKSTNEDGGPLSCCFCWFDLEPMWDQSASSSREESDATIVTEAIPFNSYSNFDEHGGLEQSDIALLDEKIELELRVATKAIETKSVRRSLLYKHDDDVRQEMFAIEFMRSCDRILKSCGLDMKILTFESIAVGERRGFIEWVDGSIPLSEICQPFAGSIFGKKKQGVDTGNVQQKTDTDDSDTETMSSVAKAGMSKYESLQWVRQDSPGQRVPEMPASNNPIQDYLRSHAYDPDGPFKIKRDVMDTYVKSCAGYSVCTYLLGVGDRHLDNLLIHHSGHFFHCDYSFLFGNDPKKYLPMRITKDMVDGMGGSNSDNFCQFQALACASFLALRRPENVRHLLSLVRIMEGCGLPDLQNPKDLENAIRGIRDRLRLDLDQEQASNYMEKLIQDSCSSKMWMAVDAIHSLAQNF